MNWLTFAVGLWVMIGLDYGLRDPLGLGASNIAPHVVMVLMVYVCYWAPAGTALTASAIVGLLLDLVYEHSSVVDGSAVTVVGPHTLGALLGAYAVINMRALVFRRNPLAVPFLAFVATALMQVVAWAVLYTRGITNDPVFVSAAPELVRRFLSAVYTGAIAIVIVPGLFVFRRQFAFEADTKRGFRLGG